MGRYLIQSENTQAVKKSIKKWGEYPVSNDNAQGKIIINNYRKYIAHEEVDITFEGKIYARIGRTNSSWRSSEILTNENYRISKVKLNRFLRKTVFKDAAIYMSYFGVNLRIYTDIKKINWK